MLVKTFQATTMAEALRQVKAELGPDAMILSTKKEKQGGFFGFFSKEVIKVTAAIDPHRPASPAPPPPTVRDRAERERTAKEEFENSMLAPLARELRELKDKVESISRREEEIKAKEQQLAEARGKTESDSRPKGFNLDNIPKQDLEELKKLLLGTLSKSGANGVQSVQWPGVNETAATAAARPEPVEVVLPDSSPIATLLAEQGVEQGLQPKIIGLFNGLPSIKGEDQLSKRLVTTFKELIRFSGGMQMRPNEPKVVALVGSTGVGKTTTTAKLAAMHTLNHGNKVALVTMDIFRVGAVEQLKTYSKIMGIPLEVASTPKELKRAIERHSDCDLILIDTAGRSHKDTEKLEEMKGFFGAEVQPEIYLCCSATTKLQELEEIVKRFSIFPISKILFTKLDEAETVGSVVSLMLRNSLQLAYFTTGQRVPEDIEEATAEKMVGMMLQEGRNE